MSDRAYEVAISFIGERPRGEHEVARWIEQVSRLRSALRAYAEEARREESRRWLDALCSSCNPNHVLDNGRVWGFCGAWKVIPRIPEEDIAAAIRAREEGKG